MHAKDFTKKTTDLPKVLGKFLPIAVKILDLPGVPKIKLEKHITAHDGQATFGRYVNDTRLIELTILDRHPVDILRTLAHELVHFKQHLDGQLDSNSGHTGSPEENEAHMKAGVIMRVFNKKYPECMNLEPIRM